ISGSILSETTGTVAAAAGKEGKPGLYRRGLQRFRSARRRRGSFDFWDRRSGPAGLAGKVYVAGPMRRREAARRAKRKETLFGPRTEGRADRVARRGLRVGEPGRGYPPQRPHGCGVYGPPPPHARRGRQLQGDQESVDASRPEGNEVRVPGR